MDAERAESLPRGARDALEARYGDLSWSLLHAWVAEDTVMAVVAFAPETAFDEAVDAFDVDIVELHLLRVFDDLQGGWDILSDHVVALGSLFEEFVQEYLDRTEPPGENPG